MPTRVLLEGPAIEPLLAQVREEYGPAARIVSADKVRSGGLAGFFAKERYELAIEIDDEPAAPADPPGPAAASDAPVRQPVDSLLALVEASQARYRDLTAMDAPPPTGTPADPTTPARPTAPADPTTPARPAAPADPTAADSAPSPAAAPPPSPVGVPPRAGLVSTTGAAFAEVMSNIQGGLAERRTPEATSTTVRPFRPRSVEAPGPTATAAPAAPALPAGAPAPDPTTPGPAPETPAGGPRTADLVRLGMPTRLAAAAAAEDPYQATLQALADVPAPPAVPAEPGDVLVLAGELAEALPLARQIAGDLHLDPTKLLLVAPSAASTGLHASRRISGPADARRRSRTLHRADVPHLVVVDAPTRGAREGWVADLADALGATAVWAVVDASRKTADTSRHLTTLGPVDAVAVYGVESTADPASVLALDVPVALLDGRPATARTWAGLLGERLQPQPPAPARGGRGRRAGGR